MWVVEVLPLAAQVVMLAEGTSDLPEWDTEGVQTVVANRHAILIATQDDRLGDVTIGVTVDRAEITLAEPVYVGELAVPTGRVEVGSILSGELSVASVGPGGTFQVEVFASPAGAASHVEILVSQA